MVSLVSSCLKASYFRADTLDFLIKWFFIAGFEGFSVDRVNTFLEFRVSTDEPLRLDYEDFPSCPAPVLTVSLLTRHCYLRPLFGSDFTPFSTRVVAALVMNSAHRLTVIQRQQCTLRTMDTA